ncbi:MAG TPA: TetR/AcrR family transcriptional regulator [Thermoanaerobaculia bacterium]|nr:TetR/AcrR family transcriptional regulator [Thermoanaerobaculia bacterium]
MREDLLDSAVELIRAQGVEALTMDRVAESAGVAKGTVYLYFESKGRLVEQAVERLVEPLVAEVSEALDSDLPAEARLRAMAEANLRFFDDNRHLFRAFVQGRFDTRTRAEQTRTPHYRAVLEKARRVVASGVAEGAFRPLDPEAVAAVWIEAITALLVRRLLSADPPALAADLDLLTNLFFDGLRAPARRG